MPTVARRLLDVLPWRMLAGERPHSVGRVVSERLSAAGARMPPFGMGLRPAAVASAGGATRR